MAIFEQRVSRKVLLDDTECLKCVIENYHSINGHTEYIIRVQRGPFREKSWHIYKRYNDFVSLHAGLQASGLSLPLPPKKLLGNMDREFISERQHALQNYLNVVLMNPILASSLTTKKFVDPDNYSTPFHEVALQQVSLALRGEVGWEVVCPLADIGWRLRKHYFHVKCRGRASGGQGPASAAPDEQECELFAGWLDYGPDKHLDDRDMQSAFKSLAQLQHPYIQPAELCLCSETGALVVRRCARAGSLRDQLCQARPRHSFLKKYGNPKGHRRLPPEQVALYGRQVLEALRFLHDKGLPYGHLHTGNLAPSSDGRRVRLLDLENGLMGVPSFYRPYFVQHRRIHSLQMIDVYSLGHALYEMSFGSPLHESVCDTFPEEEDCPPLLRSVLVSILSSEACKGGLPTIEALLSHPFFAAVPLAHLHPDERCHLKIPSAVKEQLRAAQLRLEDRLRDEQKMVRSQKRLVRVQEMMSSEEERKKRKQKAKQEQKQKEQQEHHQHHQHHHSQPQSQKVPTPDLAPAITSSVVDASEAPGATSTPPQPPPPPPPPAMPAQNGSTPPPTAVAAPARDRSALLGSICNFNKSSLRKTSHVVH